MDTASKIWLRWWTRLIELVIVIGLLGGSYYPGSGFMAAAQPGANHAARLPSPPGEVPLTLKMPVGVALSANGQIALFSDSLANTINRIDLATGVVTLLAGNPGFAGNADGEGRDAAFFFPSGIAISGDGTMVVIADTCNHTIRLLTLATGEVTTLAGEANQAGSADGQGSAARFAFPHGVAYSADGNRVLVADTGNHTIRQIDVATGEVITLAGEVGRAGWRDDSGTAAQFNIPWAVTLASDGTHAIIADTGNNVIRQLDMQSSAVTTIAGNPGLPGGSSDGEGIFARFNGPAGIALNATGQVALVADTNNASLRAVDLSSGWVTTIWSYALDTTSDDWLTRQPDYRAPYGIALAADGSIALIADTGNTAIRVLDLSTGQVKTPVQSPRHQTGKEDERDDPLSMPEQ